MSTTEELRNEIERFQQKAELLHVSHDSDRRDLFLPFLVLFSKEMGLEVPEEEFRHALAVASYVVSNAPFVWVFPEDSTLYEVLSILVKKYGEVDFSAYLQCSRLDFPMYMKINFQFRELGRRA